MCVVELYPQNREDTDTALTQKKLHSRRFRISFFLKRIPANQVVLYPQHWATGANAAGGLKTKNWPLGANKVPEKPEAALGMRRKVSGHSGLQLTPTEVIQVHKYCKGHSYTQCTSSWIRNYVSDL